MSDDEDVPFLIKKCIRYALDNYQLFVYNFKHEYLRSRAYKCLSLSSPSGDISVKSWIIEILVLTSWIPASKNFQQTTLENGCSVIGSICSK